ncbi:CHAD domain-containing protein [Phaeovulum sp.]|uniref:CHAD domain-containing protein n=1 Tax=Phaeovulum sp. TaxID=2934796 RepID=UPI002730957E|nr:CHAD domain-containing protein [Phaeovulum sp.]MDP1667959.1 CHAD domain-containing protein [Phaeovulum sp.]MDZ4119409.1 CHAD domain-containing protein [Phaeovulum sp.]
MAYCFDLADQTAGDAFRRIAAALLAEAISQARGAPGPGQLHAIRKNIKMLRGLLGLVRSNFPAFRFEDRALRDAARQIAHHREAEVMGATLALIAQTGDERAASRLAEALSPAEAAPTALRADLDTLAQALATIAGRCGQWQFGGSDFGALEDGLRRTWSRCRSELRHLRKGHDAAALHRWRGHIKAHWYHARLLQPIWPEMMAPHIAAADALGELLGNHHDLSELHARLVQSQKTMPEAQALARRCAKRQAQAERDIFRLAERLLAEPAKSLAARWRSWWRLWRG